MELIKSLWGDAKVRVPRGGRPSDVDAWVESRMAAMFGGDWKAQRDAQPSMYVSCADCGGRGWFVDEAGAEHWCSGCRGNTRVRQDAPCPSCGGAQYVRSQYGPTAAPCTVCLGPDSAVLDAMIRARVPVSLRGLTLASFEARPNVDGKDIAVAAIYELLAGELDPTRSGVLICGQTGRGKSGLCAGYIRAKLGKVGQLSRKYVWVDWGVYVESLNQLRADGQSWLAEVREAARADVLVIDDIASERSRSGGGLSDFGEAVLKNILDGRDSSRDTLITSMWPQDQLREMIGAHNYSRIVGLCVPVSIGGADWRIQP